MLKNGQLINNKITHAYQTLSVWAFVPKVLHTGTERLFTKRVHINSFHRFRTFHWFFYTGLAKDVSTMSKLNNSVRLMFVCTCNNRYIQSIPEITDSFQLSISYIIPEASVKQLLCLTFSLFSSASFLFSTSPLGSRSVLQTNNN